MTQDNLNHLIHRHTHHSTDKGYKNWEEFHWAMIWTQDQWERFVWWWVRSGTYCLLLILAGTQAEKVMIRTQDQWERFMWWWVSSSPGAYCLLLILARTLTSLSGSTHTCKQTLHTSVHYNNALNQKRLRIQSQSMIVQSLHSRSYSHNHNS